MNKILSLLPKDSNTAVLNDYCQRAHLEWHVVNNTTALLDAIPILAPDIVLIAPYLCGYLAKEIIQEIHTLSFHTKIISFLKDYSVGERMDQFKNGSDDILAVPFHPREAFLKIQRLLQFQRIFASHSYQISQDISYHPTNAVLQVREQSISLRRREGQVLSCLAVHKNLVVSREQIARWIWGDTALASLGTVDVYVKRLRQSLSEQTEMIKTVRGIGYQLIADSDDKKVRN